MRILRLATSLFIHISWHMTANIWMRKTSSPTSGMTVDSILSGLAKRQFCLNETRINLNSWRATPWVKFGLDGRWRRVIKNNEELNLGQIVAEKVPGTRGTSVALLGDYKWN